MRYEITIHDLAAEELDRLRVYDHRIVLDTIEEQLKYQPTVRTRRRKDLPSLAPGFEHVPPIWALSQFQRIRSIMSSKVNGVLA